MSCSTLREAVSPSRSDQYSLTNWCRQARRSLPPLRMKFSPLSRSTTWSSAMVSLAHAPMNSNSALSTWSNEATLHHSFCISHLSNHRARSLQDIQSLLQLLVGHAQWHQHTYHVIVYARL